MVTTDKGQSFIKQMPLMIQNNPFLTFILLLKIMLLWSFTSEYSKDLFYPFVGIFSETFTNPWQYYFENKLNLDSFPYPSMMLYVLTPFVWLIDLFAISNVHLINLIFKLPILIADIMILTVFYKLFPNQKRKVLLFYFLNPIILYASYIHSQIDIIPMALLMLSIYLLTHKKLLLAAILFGAGFATKGHILLALPISMLYVYKQHSIKDAVYFLVIVFLVYMTLNTPFLFSMGFLEMVVFNAKQAIIFDSFYEIGKTKLLLPILSLLIVYFHFYNQPKVNTDLLIVYYGLLFSSIIFLIYPSPAWYVWMVPFISIFFVQSENFTKTRVLYAIFNLAYLVFFVTFYKSDYSDIIFMEKIIDIKLENEKLSHVSFTILEAILLAIMYVFYKYGIKSNLLYKKEHNVVLGIGGDSGAGKSSFLNDVKAILGNKLLEVEGDGEHKWERGDKNWDKYTHLNPKANYIHKQAELVSDLKRNNTIFRAEYDHDDGTFTEPVEYVPKEYIVVSGLHPFYLPKMRKIIDLKIFIDTDENLRKHWKIIRDTQQRGHSLDKVLTQIKDRSDDAKKYIYPQKSFADMVINYYPLNEFKLGDSSAKIDVGLKVVCNADVHIEELFSEFDQNFNFDWDYDENLEHQYMNFIEEPSQDFALLADKVIKNINELIDDSYEWFDGYRGFLQLLTLFLISQEKKFKG